MIQGKLYNIINNKIKNNGLLKLKLVEKFVKNNTRTYVEFFDDSYWRVELTFSLLCEAYDSFQNNSEEDLFYDAIIKELMKLHGLEVGHTHECLIHMSFDDVLNNYQMRSEFRKLNSTGNQEIVIISGDSKSGKTTLVKQFCHEKSLSSNIYWLDFNKGNYDFGKMLKQLLLEKEYKSNLYIVLDNLECCGYNNALKVFNFFVSFINKIKSIESGEIYVQLIVIQDESFPLTLEYDKYNFITFSQQKTKESLRKLNCENPFFDENSFIEKCKCILKEGSDEYLFDFLFKLIVLNMYDLKYKMTAEEVKKNIEKLESYFQGIKIFNDYRVNFSSPSICKMMFLSLKKHQNTIKELYCSFDIKKKIEEVFTSFWQQCSINSVQKLLRKTIYSLNESNEIIDNYVIGYIKDFMELLDRIEKYKNFIINQISKDKMFGNHLGAILFAAETLAIYAEEDWSAMQAWKKIANYIYDTYFIDGQHLPEVTRGKENVDKTRLDFQRLENLNSIENQIKLQDAILDAFPQERGGVLEINVNDEFDEKCFSFYLSQIQCVEDKKTIDMGKFFSTYLLALLFEFEVTAPLEQRNQERINKLWKKFKNNIINSKDSDGDEYAYFYPARVPWVTARMLLALNEAIQSNVLFYDQDSQQINEYKSKLSKYLIKCNIKVNYKNKHYKICTPGTGQWNDVLETTIMTTNAVISLLSDRSIISDSLNYIENQIEKCFAEELMAEGIWAYDTIFSELLTSENALEKASKLWKYIEKHFSTEEKDKNDKSLGNTHISKTLIYLTNEFIRQLSYTDSIKKIIDKRANDEDKTKVFISFYTRTGNKTATSIWNDLKNESFEPYIYVYNMNSGNWPEQLKQAIFQAEKYILVLSSGALKSENVLNELKQIFELGREDDVVPYLRISDEREFKKYLEEYWNEFENYNQGNKVLSDSYSEKLKRILDSDKTNLVVEKQDKTATEIKSKLKQFLTYKK